MTKEAKKKNPPTKVLQVRIENQIYNEWMEFIKNKEMNSRNVIRALMSAVIDGSISIKYSQTEVSVTKPIQVERAVDYRSFNFNLGSSASNYDQVMRKKSTLEKDGQRMG